MVCLMLWPLTFLPEGSVIRPAFHVLLRRTHTEEGSTESYCTRVNNLSCGFLTQLKPSPVLYCNCKFNMEVDSSFWITLQLLHSYEEFTLSMGRIHSYSHCRNLTRARTDQSSPRITFCCMIWTFFITGQLYVVNNYTECTSKQVKVLHRKETVLTYKQLFWRSYSHLSEPFMAKCT